MEHERINQHEPGRCANPTCEWGLRPAMGSAFCPCCIDDQIGSQRRVGSLRRSMFQQLHHGEAGVGKFRRMSTIDLGNDFYGENQQYPGWEG